jgi:hypothetical protein
MATRERSKPEPVPRPRRLATGVRLHRRHQARRDSLGGGVEWPSFRCATRHTASSPRFMSFISTGLRSSALRSARCLLLRKSRAGSAPCCRPRDAVGQSTTDDAAGDRTLDTLDTVDRRDAAARRFVRLAAAISGRARLAGGRNPSGHPVGAGVRGRLSPAQRGGRAALNVATAQLDPDPSSSPKARRSSPLPVKNSKAPEA